MLAAGCAIPKSPPAAGFAAPISPNKPLDGPAEVVAVANSPPEFVVVDGVAFPNSPPEGAFVVSAGFVKLNVGGAAVVVAGAAEPNSDGADVLGAEPNMFEVVVEGSKMDLRFAAGSAPVLMFRLGNGLPLLGAPVEAG